MESGAGAGAELLRLTAPGGDVAAKTGVTLGGAAITDDARWRGCWEKLAAPDGCISVELPAASAALVRLTPEP